MKSKFYFFPALIFFFSTHIFAQGTNGLIAHWDFNGTANDVSGHGINGTVTGTTPAAGFGGLANTAYQFNGISDRIDIPYDSTMNLDSFSICALIKPLGYYSGTCQVNCVLARGWEWEPAASDHYRLMFCDNGYDDNCNSYNPANEVFMPSTHTNSTPANSAWYTGNMLVNTGVWYCVVTTYDGDSVKIFIDGAEVKAIQITDTYAPGMDPLSIAYQAADAPDGFPYYYNGIIDDIRLYGRALSQSEAGDYCTTTKALSRGEGDGTSGVSNKIAPEIVISPNPTHDNIMIRVPENDGKGYIQLINSIGQTVAEKQIDSKNMELSLALLPAGIYAIYVNVNNQLIIKKIVKE